MLIASQNVGRNLIAAYDLEPLRDRDCRFVPIQAVQGVRELGSRKSGRLAIWLEHEYAATRK